MSRIEVSVVVCTRNRATQLTACLESIAAIESERPWELVVVDNGSTDETPSVLGRAVETFPAPFTSVVEPVAGVARARNHGWRTAVGEIVAYTDDDCYVPKDFVARIGAAFDANAQLGFFGGSVVRHDPHDDRVATVTRGEPFSFVPGMFIAPGSLITSNLAFRKEVLASIGGFDEVFAYGNGLVSDDVDAVARASAAGWQGYFDPDLVVRHHHGRRTPAEVARVRRAYDAGRGAFYAKSLLDPRLRRAYFKGWARVTVDQLRHGESPAVTLRELGGAARYLAIRLGRETAPGARGRRPPRG